MHRFSANVRTYFALRARRQRNESITCSGGQAGRFSERYPTRSYLKTSQYAYQTIWLLQKGDRAIYETIHKYS